MKFFHISDLHLGKRVNEFSMIDNQSDILGKIAALAKENRPGAILIAGDVYDKSMPTVEAVQLLDRFLVWLNELDIAVFMISGNHDSVERVAFGADLLKRSNVHIARSYDGRMEPITLSDEFGGIHIWMMPYLKPPLVRNFFPEITVDTYSAAVSAALSNIELDAASRNILIVHQFVTGAEISEGSEEISVGGSENVDGSLFDAFDYVALGHIHRPQHIGRETMRYCGTPLKYSFSEINQRKSVTVVEMGGKGDIKISELPLIPCREMREVRGTYDELMDRGFYRGIDTEKDYIHIVLTDEHDEPDALAKLRNVYKNIISFRYDNKRTQAGAAFEITSDLDKKSPPELFGELFAAQNGQPMNGRQEEYVRDLFAAIWEAKF
ncbi:MAG: exonuclease SbcCD subunit D [Oscillospiraceae bacterium]|nr:exonuclease SbcCD subunit D [Oscillospiraceae bacterium]